MKVIHNSVHFTVLEDSTASGIMYTSEKDSVGLNAGDLHLLNKSVISAKHLQVVDPNLNVNKFMDEVCLQIYKNKRLCDIPFTNYTPN